MDDTLFQQEVVQVSPEQLKTIVADAVKSGLTDCVTCPIPLDMHQEVGHIFGMMRDVGDGNVERGVEVVRHNHEYVAGLRAMTKTLFNKAFMAVVALGLAAVGGAMFLGVQHWAKTLVEGTKKVAGG